MANEQNLKPFTSEQNREEAKKNGRKGGIASGEARRRKKNIYEITNMMLNAKLEGKNADAVKKLVGDIPDEALTVNSMMVAGQIKSAMNGNVKSFMALTEFQGKANSDEEKQPFRIPITDITSDFVEPYREVHAVWNRESKTREIISKGGRGSIKSNFWSAIVYETILNDNQAHCVYTRRYKTDLRGSVYNQFMKTVIRYNDLDNWDFKTSPMMAVYKPTGQCVVFVGADKPISLKSYNLSFGYVKLLLHEECDEMAGTEQMDNIEDTFLRSDTPALDIKIFNPPKSANNFMNEYTEECKTKEGTKVYHSYYNHVPVKWLGKRFFERAEWFRVHKPMYYANNYMGEVTGTGGTIFENVEFRHISDEEIATYTNLYHGLDFGYEHPQAFTEVYWNDEEDTVIALNEVIGKRCKQSTFARKINKYKNVEIICDSANPDKIADYVDWGFDCIGATKRWKGGGRDYAWEWLRSRHKFVIDEKRTPHLAKEVKKAEFELLKDGTFSSQYPKIDEDAIMSVIYALNKVIMDEKTMDNYDDYEDDIEDVEWDTET